MIKKLLILTILLCLAGCSNEKIVNEPNAELVTYDRYFNPIPDINDEYIPALNTMVKISSTDETIDEALDDMDNELVYLHKLYDNYHYYKDNQDNLIHNLKILNDNYDSKQSIDLPDELIVGIIESIKLSKLTEGYFNPFIGTLINTYDGKFSPFPITNTDPGQNVINEALSCIVTIDQMDQILTIDGNNVTFNKLNGCNSKVEINLGAISKGLISDSLKDIANANLNNYLLDVGSSNIIGDLNSTYKIGIRSPYNKVASIYAINLSNNLGLSSSGDDNNYYMLESDPSIIRSHILNPFTGYSENYYRSVSIISSSSMLADVLSTAIFNIESIDKILEIIDNIKKEYNVVIELALLQEIDGETQECNLLVTEGFSQYLISEYTTDHIKDIIIIGAKS